MDDERPIFLQVAELIENQIIDGAMPEGAQVPSINELAAFHRINPATALKGITRLVDAGLLFKQRGIGMFVADGARSRLLDQRREAFSEQYVRPLVAEAAKLGIGSDELAAMIRRQAVPALAAQRWRTTDKEAGR
ncbi:GntR family transcriptional regulator [Isoptericola sp. b441]|uniref:GntR family transcriptional regulator n=1 Tax=Actinotalea lenta TaxID=3064654 RepID=A0ABT9D5A3_9CELL|nr:MULTISPECIES: GntR family transcriptional regulator [unclassified Isoptericola]MDO8105931.1 GntR family transcriptional regulator [Isoptericola sp. b441]MDO8122646.1 GntR family transcriptional regulator [Isoptericola sp. b490]